MRLPDFDTLRAAGPECPSDFALDRHAARELPKDEAARIDTHAAGCELCGPRLAERKAGFDGIPGVDPRRMLARIRAGADDPARASAGERAMTWVRRLLASTALVAATAAVVLVTRAPGDLPATRLKGGLALHVFRLAGDYSEETISGARFHSGDRLRFVVDLPRDGALGIIGVEPSGALYAAWPMEKDTPRVHKAGTAVELPGAVELDGTVGRETLYAVLCAAPADVGQCHTQPAATTPTCPAGCELTPFTLEKE